MIPLRTCPLQFLQVVVRFLMGFIFQSRCWSWISVFTLLTATWAIVGVVRTVDR